MSGMFEEGFVTSWPLQECGSGEQVVSRCRSWMCLFLGLEEGQDVSPSTGCLINSLMPDIVLRLCNGIVKCIRVLIVSHFNALIINVL